MLSVVFSLPKTAAHLHKNGWNILQRREIWVDGASWRLLTVDVSVRSDRSVDIMWTVAAERYGFVYTAMSAHSRRRMTIITTVIKIRKLRLIQGMDKF